MRNVLMTLSALLALGAAPAGAHHSGALFYGQDQPISLTGVAEPLTATKRSRCRRKSRQTRE